MWTGIDQWFDLRRNESSRPTRTNTTIEEGEEVRKPDVIYKPKANKEIREKFYTVRVANEWNEIPEEIKAASSVNAFKNMYRVSQKK